MAWFIAAAVLFVAEMFVGTFYLLIASAALASAGLSEWLFDWPFWLNVSVATLVAVVGIVFFRSREQPRRGLMNLDNGHVVVLEQELAGGLWRVHYRGASWQAKVRGESANVGDGARIVARHANVLEVEVIAKKV